MRRTILILAALAAGAGVALGAGGVAASTAGAVQTANVCLATASFTVFENGSGVCYAPAMQEVALPSGNIYSTNPATAGPDAPALGTLVGAHEWLYHRWVYVPAVNIVVGYNHYGVVYANYTPVTGTPTPGQSYVRAASSRRSGPMSGRRAPGSPPPGPLLRASP